MRVQITASNLDRTINALRRAAGLFEDLDPLMVQIAGIMASAADESFQTERTPDGDKWTDLAESTARAIVHGRRRGYHPILRVTGQLVASIQPSHGATFAQVGTNKIYGPIQQWGWSGRHPPPDIPARAYIGLGEKHLQRIEDAIVKFTRSRLGGLA